MEHHQLFSQNSDLYAKTRPQYPPALLQYLGTLCEHRKRAWDVACGSGQAAVDLASLFDEVQATDVSEQQIVHAIQNPKVHYSVQPAEKTNFAENYFDMVCVAQALHWFEYDLFWPEVKRVLKPHGIFAAWGYSWFSITKDIDKVIKERFLDILKPYWAPQNKLLWDGYRDLDFPFEKLNSPKIEMKAEWNLDQLFAYLQSWSATQQAIKNEGEAFLTQAYDVTKKLWSDPAQKKEAKMDFTLFVGRNKG